MPANSSINKWKRQHAIGERKLARILSKFFKGQGGRLLAFAQDHSAITPSIVQQFFAADDEDAELRNKIRPTVAELIATGAANVLVAAKPKPRSTKAAPDIFTPGELEDFDLPQRVKDIVAATFEELMGQDFWLEIQKATGELLVAKMKQAIDEGLSEAKKIKLLRETFSDMTKFRARAIARTESTAAFNAGHQASFDGLAADGLIQGKEWLAISDNDVRASHDELNGKQVAAGENFNVGGNDAPFPGHWSLPAKERVNCRCTVAGFF